jgi:hypothetical protein
MKIVRIYAASSWSLTGLRPGGAWVTESFNYAVAALPAMFSRVTPALAVTLGRKPSRRCGA